MHSRAAISVLDMPRPTGLGGALDLHRIGMFGWSKGAPATALVVGGDQRVRAGLRRPDGIGPAVPAELNRPCMLMTAAFTRAADPNVAESCCDVQSVPPVGLQRRRVAEPGRIADSANLKFVGITVVG
jgi:hypothetical protein